MLSEVLLTLWPGCARACMRVLIVSTGNMTACSATPATAPANRCYTVSGFVIRTAAYFGIACRSTWCDSRFHVMYICSIMKRWHQSMHVSYAHWWDWPRAWHLRKIYWHDSRHAMQCLWSSSEANAYRFVCILIALTYVLELVFLNHFLSCDTSHPPARGSRADVLYSSENLQEKASLS